jgi:hypothetical protein
MGKNKSGEKQSLVEKVLKQQTTELPEVKDYQKEDAYQTLDRANFWLNSFDTKASYLLAIIGVIGTILFTNNFFSAINLKDWNCWSILFNLLFIFIILSFSISTVLLILCINPKIKHVRPKTERHTVLFYGSIADMENQTEELKNVCQFSKGTIIDDINNQAYFCSKICIAKKRKIYAAIACLFIFLFSFVVFVTFKQIIL